MPFDWDLYDTMTIESRLTWATNHDYEPEELERWEKVSGYEWREWHDTFSGIKEIEDILDTCSRQFMNSDDYTCLCETTISWQGKDVKYNLLMFDPSVITIPALGYIWEHDGDVDDIDPYSNHEMEARNKEYYDERRARAQANAERWNREHQK